MLYSFYLKFLIIYLLVLFIIVLFTCQISLFYYSKYECYDNLDCYEINVTCVNYKCMCSDNNNNNYHCFNSEQFYNHIPLCLKLITYCYMWIIVILIILININEYFCISNINLITPIV